MKKILLLSDTHGHLDNKIKKYIKESDEVWHAGDIGGENIIDSLQKMKPLRVVFGNIDGHKTRLQAPSENDLFRSEDLNVPSLLHFTHINPLAPI